MVPIPGEFRVRELRIAAGVGELHQAIGIGSLQGAQEDGVIDGEDGGVDSYADGQRQSCERGESRILAESAEGVANVLEERVEEWQAADGAMGLAKLRCA